QMRAGRPLPKEVRVDDNGFPLVFDPRGRVETERVSPAPRVASLDGKRLGILDNCKEFADIVLRGVATVLEREYGLASVRFWRKSYLGIPSPYAADMAANCDAVINGVGH
ncbi:MAG TPA: hypothetical protein VFK15_02565, partial [Burkholderiales bacterium]|nr:hypothetical protein [Burkholderiales bacterium]